MQGTGGWWSHLTYYPRICQMGLAKATEILIHDCLSPGEDLNLASSKHREVVHA